MIRVTILSLVLALAIQVRGIEYFDLGYSFNKDTVYFPGSKEFSLYKDYDGVNKSGVCKDGWTLDKIPPSHLIDIPATVIDVEEYVNNERLNPIPEQFLLEVQHLIEYERKEESIIPFGSVLLVHTGWSKYYTDKVKYLGWDNSSSTVNFPGVSLEAAKWLADERQIIGLGIDTPSVDVGTSTTFPVHVLFGEKQIYNIENVANLHILIRKTKKTGCQLRLFVLPIKIIGATGGPTRILGYCK